MTTRGSGVSDGNEPWHMRVVASVATRLIYFVIGFFAIPFGGMFLGAERSSITYLLSSGWGLPLFVYLAAGITAAIVGPGIYTLETTRGRGNLKEIRKNASPRR